MTTEATANQVPAKKKSRFLPVVFGALGGAIVMGGFCTHTIKDARNELKEAQFEIFMTRFKKTVSFRQDVLIAEQKNLIALQKLDNEMYADEISALQDVVEAQQSAFDQFQTKAAKECDIAVRGQGVSLAQCFEKVQEDVAKDAEQQEEKIRAVMQGVESQAKQNKI